MPAFKKVKVSNMVSSLGHRDVPNQFIISTDDGRYFQSYATIIAHKDWKGRTFLDKNHWDYSTTTGKYRNQFLGEDIEATRKKIKSGEYILVDLN